MYDEADKDPFMEDPFSWQDVRTGQPMYGAGANGMSGMSAMSADDAAGHEAAHSQGIGTSATDQTASIAGGIANVFKAATGAVGTSQAAAATERLQRMQQIQTERKQQALQAQMAAGQMGPLNIKQAIFSRYGVLIIMGTLAAVGGVLWYVARKRGTTVREAAMNFGRKRRKNKWRRVR